jgi:hypothetical protein
MLTFAERVANGVKLLDEKLPEWREHVDPEILQMDSLSDCILGQTYGHWTTAQEELNMWSRTDQEAHGFEFSVNEYLHEDFPQLQDVLTQEWIKQL